MGKPLNVGVIGCGAIIAQYLTNFRKLDSINLVAVADLDPARAQAVADSYDGVRALSVDELLAADDVDLVLNLTIPAAHADIALKAIAAGKSVYGEKPLAATTAEAQQVLDAAAAAGVTVGCAPDTVLGTGIQTARKAIDDGLIGAPISATATMATPGHERWHPNPDFYYQPGGGPLLDMGPYYVSALVTLLGPVVSVVGAASHTRNERTIGSGARQGQVVPVNIDSHVTGVLVHASGALSTLFMSFDAVRTKSPNIEIHGETGSLVVPDPNHFDGDVQLFALGAEDWETLPVSAGYVDSGRGFGIADLANTPSGQEPRAGGQLAFHALDIMESVLESARSGQSVAIKSTAARPPVVELTEITTSVLT
ncbi:Gfo/Idh/MocA family protein [Paenarthrobacter aurescens]|uniref:Oxidoreductase n=1 Tax=Paenarthrobacter aurescens TaxID=43663 RepID=A0A4Y3NCX7_PAEAU|nr:Gfo/Idh/MocA family oxidoreductase [Paenarthrobacter aurescens]MDO6143049.1 Gfo/Idh/MocA family oxidoreductase [Paenarthrobacter aurescens]MDO6146894.1 Gfo/Idh/MocA family oxidoreductase [Paenarthrobacter aurescens]MDO6158140.1 Gfo/Idh/MocA family oxidoreductase [Paenarthrobacter aurescens]MDO6162125.1 Gfo/Idh/MocA family oxidoreductase [Paenarthrobacter aurescens]GEB19794.1 oxidoreductase [Paenarthrobacter aurescens]